ncbi:unnamed protein product [Prunus armeniaca]
MELDHGLFDQVAFCKWGIVSSSAEKGSQLRWSRAYQCLFEDLQSRSISSFFGFYILVNKRDCQRWDLNLGLDSKENDAYQLNKPLLAAKGLSFDKTYS